MVQDQIRVIKISGQALFEFIYESFIEKQQDLLDLDPTEVSNLFEFDSENGEFIFCAVKTEDEKGNLLPLPKKFDLAAILRKALFRKSVDFANCDVYHVLVQLLII